VSDERLPVAEELERVRAGWSTLQTTLGRLDERQLTTPGPERWSVKDHIAHLTAWESTVTGTLRGVPPHEQFDLDRGAYASLGGDVERVNEILYERHRDRSLREVLAELERVHAETITAIEQLSDDDLNKRFRDFEPPGADPAAFGSDQRRDRTIRDKVRGDTYEHYAEHQEWIEALVNHVG
jgi:hypothetical protein